MSSYASLLLNRYRQKGILIDANLLLFYLVGTYNKTWIRDGRYNKLSKYTVEDYNILTRLKSLFKITVTTPHVLTEVSNLAGDLPESVRIACLKEFCNVLADFEEFPIPSFAAAQEAVFPFLGLTDAVLTQLSAQYLVISDDSRLIARLNSGGLEGLNFNHLRQYLL
jgi:hypothetical protein